LISTRCWRRNWLSTGCWRRTLTRSDAAGQVPMVLQKKVVCLVTFK
jgi:hypothetical protein